MIRVLVADPQPVVRRGLRAILETETGVGVIGEVDGRDEILAAVRSIDVDVLILEMRLPDDSLELVKELRGERPLLRVLVYSVHPEEHLAARAFRSGAYGFLRKTASAAEVIDAVRKVAAGGRYVSAAFAELLAEHVHQDIDQLPHERLTDREFQILRMIASGESTSDIAKSLSLSPKTVSTHRARLLSKMRLRNNAQIASYCCKYRLIL